MNGEPSGDPASPDYNPHYDPNVHEPEIPVPGVDNVTPIPDQPGTMNPPIVLTPTVDNPNPTVQDPMGNLWVWDQDLRIMRNTSADAPISPEQAVNNFQVEWAKFGCLIFENGVPVVAFAANKIGSVRRTLRATVIALLSIHDLGMFVQFQVRDFDQDCWIDPTTDPPLVHPPESDGMHNAEVKVGGGMGDKL